MRCSACVAFAVVCSVSGGSSGAGKAAGGAGTWLAAVAGDGSARGAAARGAFGVVRGLGPSIGGTAVTIGSLSIGEDTTRGGGSGVSRGGRAGCALARAFAQPAAPSATSART